MLLAYGLPKETVTAIIMLYRNMKAMVQSPDRNTDFFDIVSGILLGHIFAPYLFIICLDYILWTLIDLIKENYFMVKKARSRQYPAETITDTSTPALAESLQHSREQTAGNIDFHMNPNKTECMCFKQEEAISTKLQVSKIIRQVHILRQQYLIYWKWCWHTLSKGMDCYW